MNPDLLPKTFGFARLLTALVVLMLLAALSLLAVISSYFTRRSIEDLSDRIVVQTLARVELRVDALLQQAMTQNAQGQRLLARKQLVDDDFKLLGGFFASSLEGLTDLTYLGLGRESNGDYLFAERLPDETIRVREYVADESGQRVIRDWRWEHVERKLLKVSPWDGYDPRKRPFYQAAIAAGSNTWTDTYMFWKGNERGAFPGVTFATPFFGADGKFAGVLNSDFDLDALCKFLAEVRQEMPGYPFVVERRRDGSRRLIAHPDPSVLPSGETQTNNITELRDRPAAEFIKLVLANENFREKLRSGKSILFEAEGKEYFGSGHELTRPGLPKWAIAVIIPVNDVMGGVYANDRRAFWIGLACLIAVTILAVRLARRVAMPLRQLTREAHAIGRLELQAKTNTPSRIKEVAQLASSMSDMKSSLRSFQKFVPIDVVREIVTTATEARLGGKPALLTMFFSDIADFTSIAESMSPQDVVAHVGEYLGEMSDVILLGRGTVDKFIGDGIMAFWGAPKDNATHASDACRTAMQCQQRLAELHVRWHAAGKPELRARVGLHTGPVIVGNIGSEKRLNYTAIGDSVNLTSRIEGLNKFYGTEILISSTCFNAAGDTIVARPVDSVAVKGRHEGVVVHELLGMADTATDDVRRLAKMTTEAFAAYMSTDTRAALQLYEGILASWPKDAVARLMAERCRELSSGPLPATWDTTFRMKDK